MSTAASVVGAGLQVRSSGGHSSSISFSREGPAFPEQLVDALRAGEAVFLCGAGISAPQLPGFACLVQQCREQLRVGLNPSEETSFHADRYEEVLGSLSRRIVDPRRMIEAITQLLQPPEKPGLFHHRTMLRLSRNQNNQPTIVTTNFDTLLERALRESQSVEQVHALSSAGQDLPQPGSTDFEGIIHLHGRISDSEMNLEQTPLVITSADYGDAYMRSGWASRFLFDLCRCKTLVLVGYSASDAPVRYFLNVLEADRQRFPDLRPVYMCRIPRSTALTMTLSRSPAAPPLPRDPLLRDLPAAGRGAGAGVRQQWDNGALAGRRHRRASSPDRSPRLQCLLCLLPCNPHPAPGACRLRR